MAANPIRWQPTTILASYDSIGKLNANFQSIALLFDKCVMRDGTFPNTMTSNLNLDSHRITSLGYPVGVNDAATKGYVDQMVNSLIGFEWEEPEPASFPDIAAGTVLANITGGSAQASGVLIPNLTGYFNLFTNTTRGLVPPPTTATGKFLKDDGTWGVPATSVGSVAWGAVTGTLSDQTDLNNALTAKAPLASPAFTGVPTAPTASAGVNTGQIATTANVIANIAAIYNSNDALVQMDGVQFAGNDAKLARADHRHPTDTTRAPITDPLFLGTARMNASVGGGISTVEVGFRGAPIQSKGATYSIVVSDRDTIIPITTGGILVPDNSSQAFPVGSIVMIYNDSAVNQTITMSGTDTLRLAGTSLTGARTISQRGFATLIKIKPTEWICMGTGVS